MLVCVHEVKLPLNVVVEAPHSKKFRSLHAQNGKVSRASLFHISAKRAKLFCNFLDALQMVVRTPDLCLIV